MNFDEFERWRKDLERMMRGPLDEVRRQQQMYEEMLRPLREQRKMYEDMLRPLREQQKIYDDMLRPFGGQQKLYDEMLRPLRDQQRLLDQPLQRSMETYQEYDKFFKDWLSPLLGDLNTVKNLTAAFQDASAGNWQQDQQRALRSLYAPPELSKLIESMVRDYNRSLLMPRDIEDMVRNLATYASVSPEEPDPDTLAAVRERIEELRASSYERVSETFAALLRWLLANAPRFNKHTVSYFLFTIVYPLILAIYQPQIQEVVHSRAQQERKVLERRVVRLVREHIPEEAVLHLRYVATGTLNMRAAPRTNSSRISRLAFGDVVVVLNAKKDWTFVSYRAGDSEVRGWVYTRYLRRFRSSS